MNLTLKFLLQSELVQYFNGIGSTLRYKPLKNTEKPGK